MLRTSRPKRDDILGGWRKLGNEEFHKQYASPNIIEQVKEDEMAKACSTQGGEDCTRGFVRKLEGKLAIGRHRRR
jgi:hypothetical protein